LALSNTCGVEASIDASTHCDAERQQWYWLSGVRYTDAIRESL